MQLKSYLQKQISNSLAQLREQTAQIEEALQLLGRVNLRNTNYIVSLRSSWANEGERPTITEHQGSLEEAIKKAEQEFKAVNNRSDVQAHWSVQMQLGPIKCPVPEEYWKQYREKTY